MVAVYNLSARYFGSIKLHDSLRIAVEEGGFGFRGEGVDGQETG